MSHLYYKVRTFENFEARLEVKINSTGNSGFCFGATPGQKRTEAGEVWLSPLGNEIQILGSKVPAEERTGSLHKRPPVRENWVADDTWFTLHIVAIGNHTRVSLNGRQVLDDVAPGSMYLKGQIALQVFGQSVNGERWHTRACFRNVMIRPLP